MGNCSLVDGDYMYFNNCKVKPVTTVEGKKVLVLDEKLPEKFIKLGKGKDDLADLLYQAELPLGLDDRVEPIIVDTANPLDRYHALAIKNEYTKEIVRDTLPKADYISPRGNRVWCFK